MRINRLSLLFVSLLTMPGLASASGAAGDTLHPDHAFGVHALNNAFKNAKRTMIAPHIAHYSFMLRVGAGEFDVVRIHRVVKERRPYRPVRTRRGAFLLAGASNSFEGIFLPSVGSLDPSHHGSFALYLAQQRIDVWGMDYGWALVPIDTTDFGFMSGWGVQRDARDTNKALTVARLLRGFTGQGFGPLNLLGFSYGGVVAYALAGNETQRPWYRRNVKALIPVDQWMKFEKDANRLTACGIASGLQALVDSGQFHSDQGVQFSVLATLAQLAPDDPSPAIPGFTNRQAILVVIAATYLVNPREPFWHFFAGTFGASGLPEDLNFSDLAQVLDFAAALPPYLPNQALLDVWDTACDEKDVPFDDHLGEISVPILYVGAGGGTGEFGEFTTRLTWSDDITLQTVKLFPEDERFRDLGHADLFFARDAKQLVWRPILQWMLSRR